MTALRRTSGSWSASQASLYSDGVVLGGLPERRWTSGEPSRLTWSAARVSSQRIAGRSGRSSRSKQANVSRWCVTPKATTSPAGTVDVNCRSASQVACHQASGSCSCQPGPGDALVRGDLAVATASPCRSKARTLQAVVEASRATTRGPQRERSEAGMRADAPRALRSSGLPPSTTPPPPTTGPRIAAGICDSAACAGLRSGPHEPRTKAARPVGSRPRRASAARCRCSCAGDGRPWGPTSHRRSRTTPPRLPR